MGVLESFIAFTKGLSGEKRQAIESDLAALMEAYSDRYAFTPDEMSELDRRVAEPNPKFAGADQIKRVFGKPFSR
jgi:hypothetical protein